MSLFKQNRLFTKDFLIIKKQKGIFGADAFLKIKAVKNNLIQSRFGFVVSGRVSKRAVERNKIKRRLRAIIRNKLSDIKKGFDVIIIVLPAAQKIEFNKLEQSFIKTLKQLKLFPSP